MNRTGTNRTKSPTPEQIAERAAIIRLGWDDAEYQRRSVYKTPARVEVQQVRFFIESEAE